jgi:hypothetical protein
MYKLAIEFRKGINNGPVGQLLRLSGDCGAGEAIIQRLVDVMLLRWDLTFCKDKASYLLTAIILHSLARDPANIPHLSRCQVLLRDIVFSTDPAATPTPPFLRPLFQFFFFFFFFLLFFFFFFFAFLLFCLFLFAFLLFLCLFYIFISFYLCH